MPTLTNIEIFAVGKWNGFQFSEKDLQSIAKNWDILKAVQKVPMKFGHNNEQQMTDGYPALGWVTNVRYSNGKLLADMVDVPPIVKDAIDKKLYNKVSIELEVDVFYKSKHFDYVLSAVALLGAELPAVNTLEDLSAYIEKPDKENRAFSSSKKLSFTFNTEAQKMPKTVEELQAELDAANARNKALETQVATTQSDSVKFKAERDQLQAQADTDKKERQKAEFTAKKEKLVGRLDDLVKAKAITPAKREDFSKQITEENIDSLAASIELLGDVKTFSKADHEEGQENVDDKDKSTDFSKPDVELLSKVRELRAKDPNMTFAAAKQLAFSANPKLAKAYIDMSDPDAGGEAA